MSKQEIKQCIDNGDKHWKIVFWVSLSVSIVLIVASWFVPPRGVIDGSSLAAVGELFAFPTLYAVYGVIVSGRSVTFRKGDMEVTTHKQQHENEE